MITIDDAGWDAQFWEYPLPVREETDQHHVKRIPTRLFQEQFRGKDYLKKQENRRSGLRFLEVGKDERTIVCSGYILSLAAKKLEQQGRNVEVRSEIGCSTSLSTPVLKRIPNVQEGLPQGRDVLPHRIGIFAFYDT